MYTLWGSPIQTMDSARFGLDVFVIASDAGPARGAVMDIA